MYDKEKGKSRRPLGPTRRGKSKSKKTWHLKKENGRGITSKAPHGTQTEGKNKKIQNWSFT